MKKNVAWNTLFIILCMLYSILYLIRVNEYLFYDMLSNNCIVRNINLVFSRFYAVTTSTLYPPKCPHNDFPSKLTTSKFCTNPWLTVVSPAPITHREKNERWTINKRAIVSLLSYRKFISPSSYWHHQAIFRPLSSCETWHPQPFDNVPYLTRHTEQSPKFMLSFLWKCFVCVRQTFREAPKSSSLR